MYLNIINTIYDKSQLKSYSAGKVEAFPLRTRTIKECLLSPPLFMIVMDVLVRASWKEGRKDFKSEKKTGKIVCLQVT